MMGTGKRRGRTTRGTDRRRKRPATHDRTLAPHAPVKRLRQAIAATPHPEDPDKAISDRRFATDVLRVDERTLRRYLDRTRPIPGPVTAMVEAILAKAAAAPATTLEHDGRSYGAALQA